MATKDDLKLFFSIVQNVILLFVGAVLSFSIGVVRDISGDVNTIKVLVARGEELAKAGDRRIDRLEAKVFGGGPR